MITQPNPIGFKWEHYVAMIENGTPGVQGLTWTVLRFGTYEECESAVDEFRKRYRWRRWRIEHQRIQVLNAWE